MIDKIEITLSEAMELERYARDRCLTTFDSVFLHIEEDPGNNTKGIKVSHLEDSEPKVLGDYMNTVSSYDLSSALYGVINLMRVDSEGNYYLSNKEVFDKASRVLNVFMKENNINDG